MKLKHLAGAVALAGWAAATTSASAAVLCSNSVATTGNAGYVACQGPNAGNISPGQVDTATFAGYGTFNLVGKSDDAAAGPFTVDPGNVGSGTLSFDTPQFGYFVLGLKGGPDYSLYLFNGGSTGITSLNFDTLGITTGGGRAGPGLSHAALFTNAVPEPDTYALLLAGLAGVGFVARRRREAR
jgi:hypothetical protein